MPEIFEEILCRAEKNMMFFFFLYVFFSGVRWLVLGDESINWMTIVDNCASMKINSMLCQLCPENDPLDPFKTCFFHPS